MKITEAAAQTPDGKIWAVPRPGRHDAVLRAISDAGYVYPYNEVQGFVDEEGTFYNRADAEDLVRSTKQITGKIIGGVLTSEDLWNSWRCGYDVNTQTHGHGCDLVYERPMRKPHRRGQRINHARHTTCPGCGRRDALNPNPKPRPAPVRAYDTREPGKITWQVLNQTETQVTLAGPGPCRSVTRVTRAEFDEWWKT